MSETVKPKGIVTFKPHEKAPSFVKGTMVISLNDFYAFCKDNPNYLTEYKGAKQLRLNMLEGDYGIYFTVDTWKPESTNSEPIDNKPEDDNLPF